MAETAARIGYGTLLEYSDGASPPNWTTLAEVTNLSGPGLSKDVPDASHMTSPDGYREFISGLKDGGEVTAECNFLPEHVTHGNVTGILAMFENDALARDWHIIWPGASPRVTWQFKAVVSGAEPADPVDDKMTLSVTLKVSGKPDFTG